jgi:hypothetical protein
VAASGNRASNVEFDMEANPAPSIDYAIQPGWAPRASRGSDARQSLTGWVDWLEGPTDDLSAALGLVRNSSKPRSVRPSTIVSGASEVDPAFTNWMSFMAQRGN